jgi:hypothetical protein
MAAVAFDPLEYAQKLESAGMPQAQAEVVARGLAAMFIHNFDALVTKDYLDTRFSEQSVRIESFVKAIDGKLELLCAKMDSNLAEMEAKLGLLSLDMDSKLAEMDSKLSLLSSEMDRKLSLFSSEMDSKLSLFSSEMDSKLSLLSSEIDGKLGRLYVMFGVIMAGLAIPTIQTLITWLA